MEQIMKSLFKALDIIDALAERESGGVRELSSITGFPPATTHRILSTLAKRRYLKQDPATKSYSLSLRFLELGTKVQQKFNLVSIARPHLERLMAETEESANLAVQDGDDAVYLDHVQGSHMLQLFTRLGARVPLYATGVGKALLSQWNPSHLEPYLERTQRKAYTSNTLVDRDRLLDELVRIRSQGFSVDNQEMEEGVICVAAVVYRYDREPVAAISISGANMRITPDRIAHFGEKVRDCALAVSRTLGYTAKTSFTPIKEKESQHG
jgi:DNA-binding IclR family transcriptional regulator